MFYLANKDPKPNDQVEVEILEDNIINVKSHNMTDIEIRLNQNMPNIDLTEPFQVIFNGKKLGHKMAYDPENFAQTSFID